jgi:IclR family acetate operon transcriptional repressor
VKGNVGQARYRVAAVDRAVAILEALEVDPSGLSLAEVARRAGLSEATALRYLATLGRHGLIERDGQLRYRLGLALFRIGQQALGDADPRKVALPHMDRLLAEFEETVNLAMRHGDRLVVIEVAESQRSIKRGATIGEDDVWHASALGKAILAHLTDQEVVDIVERCGWTRFTARTLTTPRALIDTLEEVRRVGYATDDEEFEHGLRCVAAPVFDQRSRPTYALSVSAPASRLPVSLVGVVGDALSTAARSISAGLGHLDRP